MDDDLRPGLGSVHGQFFLQKCNNGRGEDQRVSTHLLKVWTQSAAVFLKVVSSRRTCAIFRPWWYGSAQAYRLVSFAVYFLGLFRTFDCNSSQAVLVGSGRSSTGA